MWIEYNQFGLPDGGRYALNVKNNGALIATKTQNCRIANGMIRTGAGVEYIKNLQGKLYKIPVNSRAVVTMRGQKSQAGTEVVCSYISPDGYLYIFSEEDNEFKKASTTIGGFVDLVKSSYDAPGDRFFALSVHGFCFCTNKKKYYERVVTNNGIGCVFHNRFFYAIGNDVCYSDIDEYNILDENLYGAGKIEVGGDGPVGKLLVFNEKVLAFMSDGVWALNARGRSDEFSVQRVGYYGDRIIGSSVARCGNTIIFANCVGELYRLQGDSFQKIAEHIPQSFCAEGVRGAGNGDCYFLSDAEGNILVSDVNGECYFPTFKVMGLTPCDGQVVGVFFGYLAEIHEKYVLAYDHICQFLVENWLERDNRERQLERIRIYGSGQVKAVVRNHSASAAKTLQLNDGGVELPVGLRAKTFELELRPSNKTKIWKIEAFLSNVGGVK